MGYGGSVGLEFGELGSQIARWFEFRAWLCVPWGSPMGYDGSVGLELGLPGFASQIAIWFESRA